MTNYTAIRNARHQEINDLFEDIRLKFNQHDNLIFKDVDQQTRAKFLNLFDTYQRALLQENKDLPIRCDHCIRVSRALKEIVEAPDLDILQQKIKSFENVNSDLRYNLKLRVLGRSLVAAIVPLLTVSLFAASLILYPAVIGFIPAAILGIALLTKLSHAYSAKGREILSNFHVAQRTNRTLCGFFRTLPEPLPNYSESATTTNTIYEAPPAYYSGENSPPPYDEQGIWQHQNNPHARVREQTIPDDPCPAYSY